MNQYQYNSQTGKMEAIKGRTASANKKVNLDAELFQTLKRYASEDGISFAGVSYVTEKDDKGKIKKDKDNKPIFKLDKDNKKVVEQIAVSQAKVNSAVALYANTAVKLFINNREAKAKMAVPPIAENK